MNNYIVYELDKIYVKTSPTLVNCLLGAVSLTKNADIDKCKYSGYGIDLIEVVFIQLVMDLVGM